MKKVFLIAILFLIYSPFSLAQVQFATYNAVECPGEPILYTVEPASVPNCTYKYTVTNGLFSNGTNIVVGLSLLSVTVTWNNVLATSSTAAPKGSIKVEVSGQTLPTGELTTDIAIILS